MAGPRIDWKFLVDEVDRHPVQGILVDHSTLPVSIQFICKDRQSWLEDVSLAQVRRLTSRGKIPGHIVSYLTQTGLISL